MIQRAPVGFRSTRAHVRKEIGHLTLHLFGGCGQSTRPSGQIAHGLDVADAGLFDRCHVTRRAAGIGSSNLHAAGNLLGGRRLLLHGRVDPRRDLAQLVDAAGDRRDLMDDPRRRWSASRTPP